MRKIEREEKLFGAPALMEDWARAVIFPSIGLYPTSADVHVEFSRRSKPDDVDRRRRAPDRNCVSGSSGLCRVDLPARLAQADAAFPGWLLVCITACGFAWRRRARRPKAS